MLAQNDRGEAHLFRQEVVRLLSMDLHLSAGWSAKRKLPLVSKRNLPKGRSCPISAISSAGDWVFPPNRLDGKQPRIANMLVEDRLRAAAVKAGILSSHPDNHGGLVDDDPRRFGFHNLRHSLASFLIRIRTDPRTVQTLLRHSDCQADASVLNPRQSAAIA
jgi:integrase